MNQILDYNPNKGSGGNKTSGSDNIVRVFAVLLIIFALCLLGSGGYGLYKKNADKNAKSANTPTEAKISVEKKDEVAIIKVYHDKAIEKIIYTWDNGKDTINKGNGESTMSLEVTLPAGEHTLTIKVTDIDGVETVHEEKITSENGADTTKPVIEIPEQIAGTKLPVKVTDETAIDYVTYRWNDDEEERIEADEDDPKVLEFDIDILKGSNDLTIIAVDKNNNTAAVTRSFKGVMKPDVKITINQEKTEFSVYCFHEKGIESVKLTLNGQEFDIQMPEDNQTPTELTFGYILEEGENTIKVKVESVEKTVTDATEVVTRPTAEHPTEITIKIEKPEDINDKAVISIKTTAPIQEASLTLNGQEYEVAGLEGLLDGSVDCPIEEGTNKIKFRVLTEDGTEKTEQAEITR